METITLAGGCFWCTEAVFNIVKGVEKVEPGYTGGSVANPTYEQVSSGITGHAEAVEITFDSNLISLEEILGIFFATHDPTAINRQSADIGTQYRSAIFYKNNFQKTIVEKVIINLNNQKIWDKPIATTVEPLEIFYFAESYHKDYYKKHPNQAYCQVTIAPKVIKLKQKYLSKLKSI
ncbi:MAG: peptide-methionine (S)-S-oxide reductase MsrA [Candidatus Lokiarchaeota archaeon]|nr:peptide-methionine (S)-S-oxide reductase MsrA [Candidatus Lokiarchaeota archaeon]